MGYRDDVLRRSLLLLLCAGCGLFPRWTDTPHSGHPIDAAAAGAVEAHQLAKGPPRETAHGWQPEVIGERATYFACATADVCSFQRVDIPADTLRATKIVARARPTRGDGTSGDEVDVYELTLVRDDSTTRGGAKWDTRGFVIR